MIININKKLKKQNKKKNQMKNKNLQKKYLMIYKMIKILKNYGYVHLNIDQILLKNLLQKVVKIMLVIQIKKKLY